MSSEKKKLPPFGDPEFAADQEIRTSRYRGPDRRAQGPLDVADLVQGEKIGEVIFDARGNPVWQVNVEIARRRKDDDTLDLIKCLDVESLALEDDVEAEDVPGFNPYASRHKPK